MKEDYFDFYGQTVIVRSDWDELSLLLRKDFSFFKCSKIQNESKSLAVTVLNRSPKEIVIPKTHSVMQSLNSITYQVNEKRFNDYYGKLTSVFDYKNERAELYSLDLDKAHEVAYLLILSRVGKKLDLIGLHKLHAFAISYKKMAFVCMMPMKGGKSTLLMELLKNKEVKLISDDIPMINSKGELLPFPIKIGLEMDREIALEINNHDENIYFLKRENHGMKKLICLEGLKDKVEKIDQNFKNVILCEAFRFSSAESEIHEAPWRKIFKGLFKHGVIGIGLPIIIEYFWEFGILDFLLKTKIFIKRMYAFLVLSFKAKKINLYLGTNPKTAALMIVEFLEKKSIELGC